MKVLWLSRLMEGVGLVSALLFLLSLSPAPASASYFEGNPTVTAFQASSGELQYYITPETSGGSGREAGTLGTTANGVESNSSPSVATWVGDFTIAFHGKSSGLWLWDDVLDRGWSAGLGIAANSSPSISPGGAAGYHPFRVAFNASGTGHLWIYESCREGCSPSGRDTGLQMYGGTSPAIIENEVAFSGANKDVWLYNIGTHQATDLKLGFWPGTSPSITWTEKTGYVVAFQAAGTHDLYTYSTVTGAQGTTLGMAEGTSPAITRDGLSRSSAWECAFHGAGSGLWMHMSWQSSGEGTNMQDGMTATASPAISIREQSPYDDEVAFAEPAGSLFLEAVNLERGLPTNIKMASGTNPSIGALF